MGTTFSVDLEDVKRAGGVSRRRTVAVVGAGAAGVLVSARLLELATDLRVGLDVLLIDSAESTGSGLAYATQQRCHVLNTSAGKMSANTRDPEDFLGWLRRKWRPMTEAGDFVPRSCFGRYLADYLDGVVGLRHGQAGLRRMRGRVVDIVVEASGAMLTLDSGSALHADAVVFAIGMFPPGCEWMPEALQSSERFISDPWAPGALTRVPAQQDLLLVGTGLTMIDLALLFDHPGRVLHAVSRHGLLPRAHLASPPAPVPALVPCPSQGDGLTALRQEITDHLRSALRTQRDWRPAFDAFRPHTAALWSQLSRRDRERFIAQDARRWEVRRHRMPPPAAAQIARIRHAGRLKVHRGEVLDVLRTPSGLWARLSGGRSVEVGAVVNCTGAQLDLSKVADPLIDHLLGSGLARPGPLGLGFDTAENGQLLPAGGRYKGPLWTLGSTRRGNLWETTAFPEIRQQAGELAHCLLAAVWGPETAVRRSGWRAQQSEVQKEESA